MRFCRGRRQDNAAGGVRSTPAFTLIELLVVVAIIAVIGAGVAVTYGRHVIDDARQQMTIHEMGQIRDAFQRFWADNSSQMMSGMTKANHSDPLPNGEFAFAATDSQTYSASKSLDSQRQYGVMQFFERHGLWPLFQKSVHRMSDSAQVQIFSSSIDSRKYEFKSPSPLNGEGWKGPYLNVGTGIECVLNSAGGYVVEAVVEDGADKKGVTSGNTVDDAMVRFPQPKTKYDDGANGGIYRVFYYEHCKDQHSGQPVYRRLILMAAKDPLGCDTWDEIREFAGNRRYSSASGYPLNDSTGAIVEYDCDRGLYFMELLNFDTVYQ